MHSVLLLPGDGQGPEAMDLVEKVLGKVTDTISVSKGEIGFSAYEKYGEPVPFDTLDQVGRSRTVVCGPCMGFGGEEDKPLDTLLSQMELYARTRTFKTYDVNGTPGIWMTFWGSKIDFPRDVAETEAVDGVTISKYIRSSFYARMMGIARSDMGLRETSEAVCVAKSDLFPESSRVFREQFDTVFGSGTHLDIECWVRDAIMDPSKYRFVVVSDLYLSVAESVGAGLTAGEVRTPIRYVGDGIGLISFGNGNDGTVDPVTPFLTASETLLDLGMVDEARHVNDALAAVTSSGMSIDAPDFTDRVLSLL